MELLLLTKKIKDRHVASSELFSNSSNSLKSEDEWRTQGLSIGLSALGFTLMFNLFFFVYTFNLATLF